jgi:hypothetical protein
MGRKQEHHFLKNGSKKLLECWRVRLAPVSIAHGVAPPQAQVNKVFLLLFVHKKKCLLAIPPM